MCSMHAAYYTTKVTEPQRHLRTGHCSFPHCVNDTQLVCWNILIWLQHCTYVTSMCIVWSVRTNSYNRWQLISRKTQRRRPEAQDRVVLTFIAAVCTARCFLYAAMMHCIAACTIRFNSNWDVRKVVLMQYQFCSSFCLSVWLTH